MMPPAWFSPRYMAFWILVILWGYLMVNMWMPELREYRAQVSILVFIATILILVGLK